MYILSLYLSLQVDHVYGLIQGKKSLYASADEFQSLIKQVLSWDIRSVSQRNRPHNSLIRTENGKGFEKTLDSEDDRDEEPHSNTAELSLLSSGKIIYHLIVEGLEVSYKIDSNGNVMVEKVSPSSAIPNNNQKRSNYLSWKDKLR